MAKLQLELATVEDDYSDAATCVFQHTTYRLSMVVGNVTVATQFLQVSPGMRADSGSWKDPAEFTIPGAGGISRPFLIGGVRFKNWLPAGGDVTKKAVVSVRPG